MNTFSGILAPVSIAAAVNIIHGIKTQGAGAAVPRVFGNVALFVSLVALSQFGFASVAKMLAILYLFSTMLTNGRPVIEWFTTLVEGN